MNDSARNNRVVVGVLDVEGVIAIPEARAIELAAIHRALATASTWGELCSVLSERSLGELTRLMDASYLRKMPSLNSNKLVHTSTVTGLAGRSRKCLTGCQQG